MGLQFEVTSGEWLRDVDAIRVARYLYKGIVFANLLFLELHPNFPRLYQSGVVYKFAGTTEMVTMDVVFERGWGSCGHLSAWRAAELIHYGEAPEADLAYWLQDARTDLYHVLVRLYGRDGSDGVYEDPSALLGMQV
jgi:hypothetical protein